MLNEIDSKLVAQLAQRLLHHHLRLATAESCTGGGIGYWLTSLSGSSEWFLGGYITYSNQAKIRDLAVEPAALDAFGAVSEEVARQMAMGCAKNTGSDLAIAVTGIAGPDGGNAEKPVGTVCFGWTFKETTKSETRHFSGDRAAVRRQTIEHALLWADKFLEELSPGG